jgi:hypothetical protein
MARITLPLYVPDCEGRLRRGWKFLADPSTPMLASDQKVQSSRAWGGHPGERGMAMPHVLRVNPRSDSAFVALADRVGPFCDRPEDLERHLRETHPATLVRVRGLSGEHIEVWYVYRDGTWTAADGD